MYDILNQNVVRVIGLLFFFLYLCYPPVRWFLRLKMIARWFLSLKHHFSIFFCIVLYDLSIKKNAHFNTYTDSLSLLFVKTVVGHFLGKTQPNQTNFSVAVTLFIL